MRLQHGLAVIVVAVGLLMFPGQAMAGGGGGGGGGGRCSGFTSGETLVMLDSCFNGVAHFVAAGGTLTVRNDGQAPHSYTAVDGSFDTGLLSPGETTEVPVGKNGLLPVYCTLHGTRDGHGMAGLLVVGDPTDQAISAASAHLSQGISPREHAQFAAQLSAQGKALDELQVELAQVRQAVEAPSIRSAASSLAPAAAGLLGAALGGAALVRVRQRRN